MGRVGAILGGILTAIMLGTPGASIAAEQYPDRPIRIIVPFGAGSPWDVRVRQIAEGVTKSIGQPIVVENRPGAGGTLGAAVAAKAAPDGYTILAGTNADQGVAPAVYKTLPYDPRKDFAPIGQVVSGTLILVVSSALGPKSVNDLIALAKERPKQLTFASYGYGTLTHLLIAELNRVSGAEITHIPYKGGPEALGDVVAGRVTMMLEFYTTAGPFIQAGKLRPLMVASARRHRALPEVPTASEVGLPTVAHLGWGGFLAPAKTPRAIIDRLNKEFNKAALAPSFKQSVEAAGADVVTGTPEEFAAFIRSQQDEFARMAKQSGASIE